MSAEGEQKKEVLDRTKILEYVANFDDVRDFEVPELSELLGVENPILRVRGATLDDQIKARKLASGPMLLLGEVLNTLQKGEQIDVRILRKKIVYDGKHPDAEFEIRLFQQCVVEPHFTTAEVVRLSEVMPHIVNRVCTFALGITGEGADNANRETD